MLLLGALALTTFVALARGSVALAPSPSATATATPRHTAIPGLPPEPTDPPRVRTPRDLLLPIAGATVADESAPLPEALRDYRAGIHEGIDFPADAGTPVVAAAKGQVIRVDREFTDRSEEERVRALEEARALGYTPGVTLDRIRGRQVWIDHGRGVVTRYAHLASVAPLLVGEEVHGGQEIGAVGSSGYPEGGPHLHFELRLGDSYLGDGLTPAQLARALRDVFR